MRTGGTSVLFEEFEKGTGISDRNLFDDCEVIYTHVDYIDEKSDFYKLFKKLSPIEARALADAFRFKVRDYEELSATVEKYRKKAEEAEQKLFVFRNMIADISDCFDFIGTYRKIIRDKAVEAADEQVDNKLEYLEIEQ